MNIEKIFSKYFISGGYFWRIKKIVFYNREIEDYDFEDYDFEYSILRLSSPDFLFHLLK